MTDDPFTARNMQARRLRRWGLYWIFVALIVLLTQLFPGAEIVWVLFALLGSSIMPDRQPERRWWRLLVEAMAYFGAASALYLGFLWLRTQFPFDEKPALAVSLLSIGIALQLWSEFIAKPDPMAPDEARQWNSLIDRIRKL